MRLHLHTLAASILRQRNWWGWWRLMHGLRVRGIVV